MKHDPSSSPTLLLAGRPHRAHDNVTPLFVAAVEGLVTRFPWLTGLAGVRRLFDVLFQLHVSELCPGGLMEELITDDSDPRVMRGLIYFANANVAYALYEDAVAEIDAAGERVPRLRDRSVVALNTAVASIMGALRRARREDREQDQSAA